MAVAYPSSLGRNSSEATKTAHKMALSHAMRSARSFAVMKRARGGSAKAGRMFAQDGRDTIQPKVDLSRENHCVMRAARRKPPGMDAKEYGVESKPSMRPIRRFRLELLTECRRARLEESGSSQIYNALDQLVHLSRDTKVESVGFCF